MSLEKIMQKIVLKYYQLNINTIAFFSDKKAAKKAFKLFCTPYINNKTIAKPTFFYEAEQISIEMYGKKMVGWQWKSKTENAKNVLILHGFNSCSFKFEAYIKELVKEGFTVLAFDAIAHGQSEGKQITVLQYKAMICYINEKFGNIYAMIAHSFGGLAAALAMEELTNVEKLVLIAPAAETSTAINNFFKQLQLTEKIRTDFNKLLINFANKPIDYFSIGRALLNVEANVLWIQDTDDLICPYTDAQKVQQLQLPKLKFILTKGLGHNRIYREKSTVNTAIDFLSIP